MQSIVCFEEVAHSTVACVAGGDASGPEVVCHVADYGSSELSTSQGRVRAGRVRHDNKDVGSRGRNGQVAVT